MANIFIIHGSYGNPHENWFPWLKSELNKIGCKVIMPEFPTPKDQSLKNWQDLFERHKKYLSNDTMFIGHSLGSAFLLRMIERLNNPIRAAFLVSPFIVPLGIEHFDVINKSFIERGFDWKKIRKNCSDFFVYHSDNDPYVPIEEADKVAKDLGVNVIMIKDAGHFNADAGYTRFDILLEEIMSLL